jgi:hypothetical protein
MTTKLTAAQQEALAWLSKRASASTGPASNGLGGHSGSAVQALVRRGLVTREYLAIVDTTHYTVTPAGRAHLDVKSPVCPHCGDSRSTFHETCMKGPCLELAYDARYKKEA